MVTAILFVQHASPSTITTFHDQISNELPQLLGPWSFELQIFLNNKFSKPANVTPNQVPNRYLYSLDLSYLGRQTISIINNTRSIVTTIPNSETVRQNLDAEEAELERKARESIGTSSNGGSVTAAELSSEDLQRNKKLLEHIRQGCCNNLAADSIETFDFLLTSKLQSLWTLKQTIKGEGGFGYIVKVSLPATENPVAAANSTTNGNGASPVAADEESTFRLRTSNCFLHGAFKGFLIEIEDLDDEDDTSPAAINAANSSSGSGNDSADGNANGNANGNDNANGPSVDGAQQSAGSEDQKNQLIVRFTRSINKIKALIDAYNFPEGNLCFNVLSETKLDPLSDLCQQYCDALQF